MAPSTMGVIVRTQFLVVTDSRGMEGVVIGEG